MTSELDPATERRVRDSFAKQGLMTHLGARIESVTPGRVVIALPHRAEVTQQNGYIHAGATSAVADTAGGYATLTLCPPDSDVLTVEYKINLVAPASGSRRWARSSRPDVRSPSPLSTSMPSATGRARSSPPASRR